MKKLVLLFLIIIISLLFFNILKDLKTSNEKKEVDEYGYVIENMDIYNINKAIEEGNIDKVIKLIKETNLNALPLKELSKEERNKMLEIKEVETDGDYADYEIDYYNYSPLVAAIREKRYDIVELLIENGANVNFLNNNKTYENSAIFTTISAFISERNLNNMDTYIAIMELLIKKGAIINANTDLASNPLVYISYSTKYLVPKEREIKAIELFKLLLNSAEYGPDQHIKDEIIKYLSKNNSEEIIKYLEEEEHWDIR